MDPTCSRGRDYVGASFSCIAAFRAFLSNIPQMTSKYYFLLLMTLATEVLPVFQNLEFFCLNLLVAIFQNVFVVWACLGSEELIVSLFVCLFFCLFICFDDIPVCPKLHKGI